jgi:hypothetical protein
LPVVKILRLPRSLVEAFVSGDEDRSGWGKLLTFLSPITISGGLASELSR